MEPVNCGIEKASVPFPTFTTNPGVTEKIMGCVDVAYIQSSIVSPGPTLGSGQAEMVPSSAIL
jgi:hypothetical protein